MVENEQRPRAAIGCAAVRAAVLGALLTLFSGLLPAAPAAADDIVFWQNRFSSQLLDVKNGTTANEGPVVQQHYNGQPPNPNGQYWRVVAYGGGLRRAFMNTWSGKYLDKYNGFSGDCCWYGSNQKVQQYAWAGGPNQTWIVERVVANGTYRGTLLKTDDGCCTNSISNSTDNGCVAVRGYRNNEQLETLYCNEYFTDWPNSLHLPSWMLWS